MHNLFLLEITEFKWELLLYFTPLLFTLGSITLASILGFIWEKKRKRVDILIGAKGFGATDDSLRLFYGWVPFILGFHVAVALMVNGIRGNLFTSEFPLTGFTANWVGLTEIMIALSFFYGGITRPAAVLLGILWWLTIVLYGVLPTLENIQFLGYACFFFLAGRGPYSIDRLLFPNLEPKPSYTSSALYFLRVCVGLNLIVFAFFRKYGDTTLAADLISPQSAVNYPILFASAVELLAGILIVFGIFPRITMLATIIFINTLFMASHWNAFVDYFPMLGALAILLVWEPDNLKQKLLWVEEIRKKVPKSEQEIF
ncbi:MAG: hypothetical protein WC222_10760 [Parachlamydiales bacterium]|jgi:uncharacterized membrane protein YphA (DoxX/SURF4 family)